MLDKKKAREEYKHVVHPKGVYAVKNKKSGKLFLAGTLNLYNIVNRVTFRLNGGNFPNEGLLKDWQALGEGAFTVEILETLPLKEDPAYNYDEDLRILEMLWVEKYQPLAERTYNEKEDIRLV